MHSAIEPAILYFGTPVAVIGTCNEDGTYNLAPMSSIFWLGWRCVLGLGAASKTAHNLRRTGQCVVNLPSVHEVDGVNRLALTTGADPVPEAKAARGYRHVKDKFAAAGWIADAALTIEAPRVRQCPVQLEASVEAVRNIADDDDALRGRLLTFELRIKRVHVAQSLRMEGAEDRIDPDKWRPLIMSFQKFYGLEAEQLHASTLSRIPEAMYRSPEIDRARQEWSEVQELRRA